MNNYLTILFISLCSLGYAQEKARIGMSKTEVKNVYPKIFTDSNKNEITFLRPDTLYGLDDSWGYRFKEHRLDWIYFHKYFQECNETNFNKCLAATRKMVKDYSKYYGKPDTSIVGNSKFVDPMKTMHYGYDVLEVRWNNFDGMKINIEFTFFGGKGEYFLLLSIHYFDKDYPYFN